MTGIERLRTLAGAWDEWGLGGTLADIADQIERELARHDEPDSTDKGARLLYVTDEDREALEWVRKYGGVGCVQTMAAKLGDTLNWIRERAGIGEDEVVDYNELLDALDRRLMPEIDPSQLTHAKPEPPDSAERIADEIDRLREEVALHLGDYLYDEDGNDSIQFSMECVAKRCRALAERERGE